MQHFHRFPIGERVLCLDEGHDLVRIANLVAASMWEMRSRGLGVVAIVDAICAEYEAPHAEVDSDARRFFAEIEALERGADAASIGEAGEGMADGHLPPDTTPAPNRPFAPRSETTVALPCRSIVFRSESTEICERVSELFARGPNANGESADHVLSIDIFDVEGRFPIVHDGLTLDTGLSIENASWLCVREVCLLVAKLEPRLVIFHAAAIERAGRAILLPALSGSGKSTLTAWLVARGHRLLNDDVVPLTLDPHRLLPVPVALSIKQGAWPLLGADYPSLANVRIYGASGTRPMKYLVPEPHQMLDTAAECSHIVFPTYDSRIVRRRTVGESDDAFESGAVKRAAGESETSGWQWVGEGARYRPLAPDVALERLIESGSVFDRPFRPERLAELVSWVESVPCHELRYSSLEDARSVLESLA